MRRKRETAMTIGSTINIEELWISDWSSVELGKEAVVFRYVELTEIGRSDEVDIISFVVIVVFD